MYITADNCPDYAAAEYFCRKANKRQVPYNRLIPISIAAKTRKCDIKYIIQTFDILVPCDAEGLMHPDDLAEEMRDYYLEEIKELSRQTENSVTKEDDFE